VKIIHRIKRTGTLRPTGYDGQWQELIDLVAIVTDEPPEFYFPSPNYLPSDRTSVESYLPQILDDAEYREGVKYTYGQRLRSWFGCDQIEQVVLKLIGEIDAASAVMSLWDAKDHDTGGSPCLNHIWVRVVDNELSLTATFRSNDMFSAWSANAMGLRALQRHLRDEISKRSRYNLRMGPLITISQSAHIYDDTFDSVDRIIKDHYQHILVEERSRYSDTVGNFIVEIQDGSISVAQTTPGTGEIVASYKGKNPLSLLREICADSPAIAPEHSGYLGLELQKALDCIKNKKDYVQDR
jgi:thymidylate synthase